MIISFGSKDTEKICNGIIIIKKPSREIEEIGRRKLRMLNNSIDKNDIRISASNRLEKLSGNLKDFYSIRINEQWRIIFIWENENTGAVEIMLLPKNQTII